MCYTYRIWTRYHFAIQLMHGIERHFIGWKMYKTISRGLASIPISHNFYRLRLFAHFVKCIHDKTLCHIWFQLESNNFISNGTYIGAVIYRIITCPLNNWIYFTHATHPQLTQHHWPWHFTRFTIYLFWWLSNSSDLIILQNEMKNIHELYRPVVYIGCITNF